uniref:Nuclease HARBI1 n=1 Tax=Cacopsylla melanoneura TaxID=428564 RepID=A0A8D9E207_9HEMI
MLPPPTEERWRQIALKFEEICKFPNCIGAVDGKHVVIQAPKNSGSQFFNYKKTFSTVLMALVDAECNFIAVDVGGFGRHSDGGIFAHSNLGKALETGRFNVPGPSALPGTNAEAPYVVVGDQAFPLKNYLMRPYPGENLPKCRP